MIHLRKYQTQGEDDIRALTHKGHKRIIWTCATGGGKTVVGADITDRVMKRKKRVLWLVHRDEISTQTVKKLVLFGHNPGIIQGDNYMANSLCHVAMVQTLSRRIDFLSKNDLLPDCCITDEVHHCAADSWLKIYDAIAAKKPDCLFIGLTATGRRTDGLGLNTAGYTALINGPQYADLLNPSYTGGEVYLSEPVVVYSPLTFQLSQAKGKKKNKDYDPNEEQKIFGEKIVINNCVDLYNKYFLGAPCIIFGASVNDCLEVTAAMRASGWKGGTVYDSMDIAERKDYIEGLGNGKYNFLCSYDILGEGVDIPVVAGCIKRRRTTSIIIEMQQNGRPARKYPGKKYNLIIDQCGNSLIHGHPLTRREWSLEGVVKTIGEPEIKMTICPGCNVYLAGNPSICPYCGEVLKGDGSGFQEESIREVPAPMEILPAPAQQGFYEATDIEEFEIKDREQEVINRIASGHLTSFDRFGELAKMIGKDRKWTDLVWRKYHAGN
ncbi:MAG: DEAD/DEAH box helicase family protein [Candidatus Omnitrophica bacterium]|nr:DEAD/DEAH box helicase family protein [Candidatus Omnitrophota bacterium]MDD5353100.1 DEAD/DEAH box helicase family protein [Candidatus Omnitrophota bacterium]